jgi:hypothetical protein
MGSESFAQMPTEKQLLDNAIQGIALALLFSFIIVLLSTQNIINALLAIFCVAMVIFSITAFFY